MTGVEEGSRRWLSSIFWLLDVLVLLVFGGIRIVAVAVAIPDRAVLAVNDDFHVFPLGLLASALDCGLLRVNNDACAGCAFRLRGPAI